VLVRLAPVEPRHLDLRAVENEASGHDAEADVGAVEPVMRDRRLGRGADRLAMHEGGRAEGGLAGQRGVDEGRRFFAEARGIAGRQLHAKVVRVLPIDETGDAVPRLATGRQQGIAPLAHTRIGADHSF